jgi:hypothetical protein
MIDDLLKFESLAHRISSPLLESAKKGLKLSMPIETEVKFNFGTYDSPYLEFVGRLFCGLGPWIEKRCEVVDEGGMWAATEAILDRISDPGHCDYLNFNKGLQPLVDAAFLATGFLRAPKLWHKLSLSTQNQLISALLSTRKIPPYYNNWLLFSAVIEAFFCKFGFEWDSLRVDYALRKHEEWYLGDGIYGDGPRFHFDYYNSYVIHPLLLEIHWAVKGSRSYWDDQYPKILLRAQRHAIYLERIIGIDGGYPPIGRSLSYRCGAFHLLSLLAAKKLLPNEITPSQVRGALTAVIQNTLEDPVNYCDKGWLRIGINGAQPLLGENYISTGSLYLCSTAFLPLCLSAQDPFWMGDYEPWTQRKLWGRQGIIQKDKAIW